MVGRFVEGMEARYPLFNDLDDGGRVYWDLSALEAFWIVDVRLIRVRPVSDEDKTSVSYHTCEAWRGAHVSFQMAKCRMPNACDVQW